MTEISSADRKDGKPASWEGVGKGDRLNSAKKYLKKNKSNEDLPKLPESSESFVKQVEKFITQQGIIEAVDGRRVNLANPDNFEGNPPTIKQRAAHLITRSKDGNYKNRANDTTRRPFVAAIPKTLSDADLVATGKHHNQDRIYYFKNYKQGTHLVVTDKRGNILEHGEADGLLTQYPVDLNVNFDGFRITYKKGGIVSDASESLLIPTTVI
jgi:hypothetical protein